MRTLHLAFLGLAFTIGAAAACSGAESGPSAGAGASANGQNYGDWSYPGDGKTSANTDMPSTGSSSSGASLGTGGSDGTGPGASSSGIIQSLDCHYDTAPVKLTLPGARLLSSPAIARGVTTTFGHLPDPNVVHPSDFLNYYAIKYAEPAPGTLGLSVGLSPVLDSTNLVIQIGVQAPAQMARPRLVLAVVVDSSISMAGSSMKRARDAVTALTKGLAVGDAYMLTTSLRAGKPDATTLSAQADLDKATADAKQLDVDGGGDLGGALDDAYLAVNAAMAAGGVGRVVLVTDGAAQPTAIDLGVVAGNLQKASIPLIGVGVGDALHYDPKFLDVATAIGGGGSVFVDDKADEADSVLHKRFDEIMFSVADDVEVTLTLPSVLRLAAAQGGSQGGSPSGLAEVGIGPGRSLVFRQNLETCATALSELDGFKIDVAVRFRRPGESTYTPIPDVGGTVLDLQHAAAQQVAKGDAIAAYADAVAGVRAAQLNYAASLTDAALMFDKNDPELLEIKDLVAKDLAILNSPTN